MSSESQTAVAEGRGSRDRSPRARAPVTSATARRRAASLNTGLPIIILCTRTARNKRRRRRGAGGERSPQERLPAPSSGPRGDHSRLLLGLRTIEPRRKLRRSTLTGWSGALSLRVGRQRPWEAAGQRETRAPHKSESKMR